MSAAWVRPLTAGPVFDESITELAQRVSDDDIVSIGGFHFCRQPVALVEAIAASGVRRLHHLQWGGALCLEILLAAGAVSQLTFCFSNLDVYGLAPQFRRALETGAVQHTELTALELHHALLAAQMNLDTIALQVPAGSWRQQFYDSGPAGPAPQLEVGAVLLHAQRADKLGNLELDGPLGLDRTLALAGRRVLATVEEIAEPGTLTSKALVIPRQFVTAIALAPGGAWPTSCPGWYLPDHREILRRVRAGTPAAQPGAAVPGAAGPGQPVPAHVAAPARLDWARQRWPGPVPAQAADTAAADLMVAWLSRQLDDTSVCSVGAVSPMATTAYLLAKRSHAPRMTIVSASGGCVDIGARFMSLSFGEAADVQSAAHLCGGDDSYRWFYQQSRVTHEVVSAAQIDATGATNNSWIPRPGKPALRLPGQGGMADVANMHRNFILYATRQSPRQLVEAVGWVSAARALHSEAERAALGYGPGRVRLLTNLAVFDLDEVTGRFVLTATHPGVSAAEVADQTGFAFTTAADVQVTEPPTAAELKLIDEVDPFGVRLLEFTPAHDRDRVITAILDAEQRYLETL